MQSPPGEARSRPHDPRNDPDVAQTRTSSDTPSVEPGSTTTSGGLLETGERSGEVRLAGCKEGVRVIQLRTWPGSGPTNRVNETYVPVGGEFRARPERATPARRRVDLAHEKESNMKMASGSAGLAVKVETQVPKLEANGLKILSHTLKVVTDSRVELYNVTDRIRDLVRASGVKAGFLIVSTLHTTTAVFINEFQAALMADVKTFLERFVNKEDGYLHNCEDCSDCDRKNADSHLRAMLLGHNLTLPIEGGSIILGKWQSILFAELDGPRERIVTAQVIGI